MICVLISPNPKLWYTILLKVTYLGLMPFRYRCAPLGVVIDISKAVDEYTKAWREKMEKFGAEHLREEAEE